MNLSNVSTISPFFVAIKLCLVASNFVVAGLMISSDMWKSDGLTHAEEAGSTGLGVIGLIGGFVSFALLISYVLTTLMESASAKVQNLTWNFVLGVAWLSFSLVFVVLFLSIYVDTQFWVPVSYYDSNGHPDVIMERHTIFSRDFPDHRKYVSCAVFGFLSVFLWATDCIIAKITLKRVVDPEFVISVHSLSFGYIVVKVLVIVSSLICGGLMAHSRLWKNFGAGSPNQVASKAGLGIVGLLGGAVGFLLLLSYVPIALTGSPTDNNQHRKCGMVLSSIMFVLSTVFSFYFIGVYCSSHWQDGEHGYEFWWDTTIFANQYPGHATYIAIAVLGLFSSVLWVVDICLTYTRTGFVDFKDPV
eukprot:Clim_evm76s33 gene=Clim_evmTU76s33